MSDCVTILSGRPNAPKSLAGEFCNIGNRSQSEISSTGYVLHSLEAGICCLLTTDCYRDAVLEAVNLGNDTDTAAAITGGLAGIFYGTDGIHLFGTNSIMSAAFKITTIANN